MPFAAAELRNVDRNAGGCIPGRAIRHIRKGSRIAHAPTSISCRFLRAADESSGRHNPDSGPASESAPPRHINAGASTIWAGSTTRIVMLTALRSLSRGTHLRRLARSCPMRRINTARRMLLPFEAASAFEQLSGSWPSWEKGDPIFAASRKLRAIDNIRILEAARIWCSITWAMPRRRAHHRTTTPKAWRLRRENILTVAGMLQAPCNRSARHLRHHAQRFIHHSKSAPDRQDQRYRPRFSTAQTHMLVHPIEKQRTIGVRSIRRISKIFELSCCAID